MMKKFLFTLAAAFVTLTASAQVYVGGEVGFGVTGSTAQTKPRSRFFLK